MPIVNGSGVIRMTEADRLNVLVTVVRLLMESGLPNIDLIIACGIAGNIDSVSEFNYTAYGDDGTSYGLCMWNGKHLAKLIKFCEDNNLQYSSPEGQIKFLVNDLKTEYSEVYNIISSIEIRSDIEKVASKFCSLYGMFEEDETVCSKRGINAKRVFSIYNKVMGQ